MAPDVRDLRAYVKERGTSQWGPFFNAFLRMLYKLWLLLSTAFSKTLYKQVRRRTSPLLCEPQYHLLSYTFLQLSWLASEIQPCATELCSLPLRDQITGRGSNTTQLSCVRSCFLHQLRSVELLNMSVGSNSIIC
jgi:hypothetical protein